VVQLLHDGDLLADQEKSVLGLLGLLGLEAQNGSIGSAKPRSMEAARLPWAVAEDVGLGAFPEP
jgi:hypothetical protein